MIVAAFATVPATWGLIHVAVTETGVVAISPWDDTATFADSLARRLRGHVVPDGPEVPEAWRPVLAQAREQLAGYIAGRRSGFDLPLDLRGLTEWEQRVLRGAATIEYGEVVSYGELAFRIGAPRAARAVGNAMGRNPIALVIPCHRVIAGDGTIGGYGGSSAAAREEAREIKRMLLLLEGVELPVSGPPTSRTRRPRSASAAPR